MYGEREGPYSVGDLKHDHRVTPDTLAWKSGFLNWIPMRDIAELDEVFKDEVPPEVEADEEEGGETLFPPDDEITLDWRREPPFFIIWLLIIALLIAYAIYQFVDW